jgi:hypothetical protein
MISSVIDGSLVCVGVSQPDPTDESPMTTREAARSLQRYGWRARERLPYRPATPSPGTRPGVCYLVLGGYDRLPSSLSDRLATPSNPLGSGSATGTGRSDSLVRARFFGGHLSGDYGLRTAMLDKSALKDLLKKM